MHHRDGIHRVGINQDRGMTARITALSLAEVAERTRGQVGTLSRYKLPEPDAQIGI